MLRLADLREMLRYVPHYRDRIFVIAIDGSIVECDNFRNLLLDIALLRSLRIGVALVHGAGHQIRRLADAARPTPSNIDGTGITDPPTLRLALSAATGVTHEILEGLAANDLRGACSNAVVAHPAGILQGIDQQWTGRVERIDIATYRFASVMRNPNPPNYFASKYSLPHAAAVMTVRGNAGFAELDDGALDDPAIAVLRHRVHVTEDQAMSAVAPRLRPAQVMVTLTDGRQVTRSGDSYRGDFQRPFTEAEIRAKFRELAGVVLTPEGVSRVEAAVERCEHWQSIDELTGLLRGHGRP